MQRKRRMSNIIGIAVFATFVTAILIAGAVRMVQNRGHVQEARNLTNEVAAAFADNDVQVIDKWSRGQYVDPWQNQLVLLSSGPAGVQMVSKGPDGNLDTGDDIISDLFVPKLEKIQDRPKEVPPAKKGIFDRMKSFFKKKDSPDA